MNRTTKLRLNRETIRNLDNRSLRRAVGGLVIGKVQISDSIIVGQCDDDRPKLIGEIDMDTGGFDTNLNSELAGDTACVPGSRFFC